MKWLDALPTQIVLDKFRLVHAGYDPRMALDSQGDKELLWIRKTWYDYNKPVDPERTVIFGHTTTMKLGAKKGGDIAKSTFNLADRRPAWIALDTGAYNHVNPGLAAVELADLTITKQPTLRTDMWFNIQSKPDRYLRKVRNRARKWRLPDNRKESNVADSFGLKTLQQRTRQNILAEDKARHDINKISRLIPSLKGHRIAEQRKPFTWRKIAKRARNNVRQQAKGRDVWQHNGRTIMLGPGTEINRQRPQLPSPHSFSFYRSKQIKHAKILESHIISSNSRSKAR